MKQKWRIRNIQNTFARRVVICLCILPTVIILLILACLAGIIEGLKELNRSITEFLGGFPSIVKKTWRKG